MIEGDHDYLQRHADVGCCDAECSRSEQRVRQVDCQGLQSVIEGGDRCGGFAKAGIGIGEDGTDRHGLMVANATRIGGATTHRRVLLPR
jgi:hypothetical protein